MLRLPLVEAGRGLVPSLGDELPRSDLNECFRIGVRVASRVAAENVLRGRFTVLSSREATEVWVRGGPGLTELLAHLEAAGIGCGVGDVVDQLYRG